ncbi:MAG: hypothetical protein GX322_09630 [Firmicutes bacterium]|nr:hypothetical protein [Bacillota bacterium]
MIDVILLTGFLGSGKTTCLNQLLPRLIPKYGRVAVVMNEFGSVGIDGRLIENPAHLVELQNGSIFCICIRENFLAAMANLANNEHPELVIMEATGVADPLEMGDFLSYPALEEVFRLRRTITLIDAVNFPKVVQTLRAARSQALAADVFLVTKMDLLEPGAEATLKTLLKETNPRALQFEAPFCRLSDDEWGLVLGQASDQMEAPYDLPMAQSLSPARDPVTAVTLTVGPFADIAAAQRAILDRLSANVLRAKGFIRIGEKVYLFQHTMGETTLIQWEEEVSTIGQLVLVELAERDKEISD